MAKAIWDTVAAITEYIPLISLPAKSTPPSKQIASVATREMNPLIRLAGVSGAAAISLGAYGSHLLRDNPSISERRRTAFDTGSRYHLIHSLALVASTQARYPTLTASIFAGWSKFNVWDQIQHQCHGGGILLFCGPCYHYGITGNEETRRVTPIGGILFIIGWLSFCL